MARHNSYGSNWLNHLCCDDWCSIGSIKRNKGFMMSLWSELYFKHVLNKCLTLEEHKALREGKELKPCAVCELGLRCRLHNWNNKGNN